MKDLKDMLIDESMAELKDVDINSPVMFSVYGNNNGPWLFGYKLNKGNGVISSVILDKKSDQVIYPKLIIDFDKFDPKNMNNNNH